MPPRFCEDDYYDYNDDDDYYDDDDAPAPPKPKAPAPKAKTPAAPAKTAAAVNKVAAGAPKPSPAAPSKASSTAATAAKGESADGDTDVKGGRESKRGELEGESNPPSPSPALVAGAASAVSGLSLGQASSGSSQAVSTSAASHQTSGAASGPTVATRIRIGDYTLEPDLARALRGLEDSSSDEKSRKGLHLIVLGHVDAGKSTLMGRLLHDLGVLGKKEAHKNAKESAEAGKERSRGVTVDIAMQRFQTPLFNVTLMDAPGHRDFVPNMISGAAQADAALLLVDASIGGFESGFDGGGGGGYGQTREHAQLARSLGVEQMAVVISKLDMVDFSQERFEHIKSVMLPFLTKTCGFKETALQWLPALGPTGENLVTKPTEALLTAWWSGPTVVAAIDHFSSRERLVGKPLRMPIADVFRTKTGAMALGGKIEGGALKPGMHVLVVPNPLNEVATVKGVDVDGQSAQVAQAGDSVDVVLNGLDLNYVAAGAVLCHADFPAPFVSRFEARILVLEVKIPILKGHQVTLHAHTSREAGHISGVVSLVDPKTGETTKMKPRCILKGQTAVVEITPARPMCLEEYSDYKALGRVALREGGKTIAVGIITRLLE
eukprot:gene32723-3607_t